MTLQQLKYIAEVERCGSLRKAAKSLYVSQPNISKQIASLEEELGVTIFNRTTNGIVLTHDGQRLMQYVNSILKDTAYIEKHFHDVLKYPSLSISAQHFSFASEAYSFLQQELEGEHERYSLSIAFEQTDEIFERVVSQQSEIGLTLKHMDREAAFERIVAENNLEFCSLFKGPAYAFMHKDHPLAAFPTVTAEQLVDYPCILYLQGNNAPHFFSEEVMIPEIRPKKLLYINDLYSSMTFLKHNHAFDIGTGLMPLDLWNNDVVAVPLENSPQQDIGYLKLCNTALSPLARRYIELVEESIDDARTRIRRSRFVNS